MTQDISNITRVSPLNTPDITANRKEQRLEHVAATSDLGLSGKVHTLKVPGSKIPDEAKTDYVSSEELKSAVDTGNAMFQSVQRNLQIEVDDSTHKVVVKVVDRASGEVIRQMPTKEVLNFVKQMQEQQGSKGNFIKGSA